MNITVYCGASLGNDPRHQQATIEMGKWIAEKQHTLIYGGGRAGLMGLVADTVLTCGGKAIGIIPTFLKDRELAHEGLTELHIVESMTERKLKLLALADVCIALPGGPGTLEEIAEVYSWARIGKNDKPCIFWNVAGFYDPIKAMFQSMVDNGFLTQDHFDKLLFADSFEELEQFIQTYQPMGIRTY